MKIEVSDALARDFERLIKERRREACVSEEIESLIAAELRRACAPGYETDQLTGCWSYSLLQCDLERALSGAGLSDHSLFISKYLCLDIVDFKSFNEAHSFSAGDDALIEAADGLKAAYRGAKVYRYGGDEFVVELNDLPYVPLRLESGVRFRHSTVEVRVRRNTNRYRAGAGIMFYLGQGMQAAAEGEQIVFRYPGNI